MSERKSSAKPEPKAGTPERKAKPEPIANGRLIPAVGYTRRSTDKQEASLQDQKKAVQRYADEHGYTIVRWYTDDGVSGDDTERRHDFRQMIADARERGDFKTILCWDQDRFGRFDPLEAGYWIKPLRDARVGLETVAQGQIEWNDFTGRLAYIVQQEAKHAYLKDLSRNVTRGQLEAANNGSWIGSPPYAYRIEGGKKNKRLILDDPSKVRIVQRIFREFVEDRRALHNIADRLNAEGLLSPGGREKGWRFDTVKVILENPAYTGDYAGARWSYGKYHRIKSGKVEKSTGRTRNAEDQWIIRRDHHEPIIDRSTFERAKTIIAKGKTGRSPHTPETNPYVLSCLMRCGRCGCQMHGKTKQGNRYYQCGNRHYNGNDACAGTTVREDVILRSLADHLENWLGIDGDAFGTAAFYGALKPDDLPEAFAEVRKLVTPRTMPHQDRRRLEKQAGELTAKLAKARENLVLLDPANIPAAQDRIRRLDEERAAVEQELKRSKPPAERDVNAVVLEVLSNLYALGYCCRVLAKRQYVDEEGNRGVDNGDGTVTVGSLESATPRAVKRLLNRVSHIVCHTTIQGWGNGIRHAFDRGEIIFDGVGTVTGNSNPHLPGASRPSSR
jgi:DNA invertase Pin-like site-specific DNA recombinase